MNIDSTYVLISVDCGVYGTYEHLYREGVLLEQDGGDGWEPIPWRSALRTLNIPFVNIEIRDDEVPDDFLPSRLEEWSKYI